MKAEINQHSVFKFVKSTGSCCFNFATNEEKERFSVHFLMFETSLQVFTWYKNNFCFHSITVYRFSFKTKMTFANWVFSNSLVLCSQNVLFCNSFLFLSREKKKKISKLFKFIIQTHNLYLIH